MVGVQSTEQILFQCDGNITSEKEVLIVFQIIMQSQMAPYDLLSAYP